MVHKIVWKLSGEPKLGITHLNLSDGCPYESHQTARLVEHFSGLEALSISSYEFLLGRKLKLQAAIRSQPQLRKLYVKFCERPRPFQITTMMAPPLLEMAEGLPYLECLVLDSPALGLGNDWGGGIEATAKFVSAD